MTKSAREPGGARDPGARRNGTLSVAPGNGELVTASQPLLPCKAPLRSEGVLLQVSIFSRRVFRLIFLFFLLYFCPPRCRTYRLQVVMTIHMYCDVQKGSLGVFLNHLLAKRVRSVNTKYMLFQADYSKIATCLAAQ